jgi:SAM-dependent methyltransferase
MNELKGWMARGDNALIVDYLPTDHSRQSDSLREAARVLQTFPPAQDVLIVDLGCGVGSSFDVFRWQHANVRWIGLDIERSPEVDTRTRTDVEFLTYDGVHIPLADQSVDIVYSRQVFEHVRHPQVLIEEVHRVLKQDGVFVGSTSHLEPFHSRSYWNYTPYGFCVLLRDASFRSILVRPGIDSLTLIGRRWLQYLRLAALLEPFFTIESPANFFLEAALRLLGQSTERRNAFKLLFAGQFCFFGRKHTSQELVANNINVVTQS